MEMLREGTLMKEWEQVSQKNKLLLESLLQENKIEEEEEMRRDDDEEDLSIF